ncbi:hypothetical protein J3A83DRAFT_4189116 [Scleroderma citrinum]
MAVNNDNDQFTWPPTHNVANYSPLIVTTMTDTTIPPHLHNLKHTSHTSGMLSHLNATKGYVQVPALNTNSLAKCGVAGALGLCGVVVSLNELLSGDIEFKSMSCLLATWHELTKSNKIGKHSTLFSKEEKNLQYPSIQDNGLIRINDSIPSLEPVLKGSRESDKRHSVVRMIGGSEFEWRTWKGDKGTRGHQGSRVSGVLMQLIQAKSLEPFPNVYQWTWHDRTVEADTLIQVYWFPLLFDPGTETIHEIV